jgi:uncharacterized membrane protein YjjB (DUF3815 family)
MDLLQILHQSVFGAVAAVGFGVLFNFGPRALLWCAVTGALALCVRTLGLDAGWSLEAASFAAAVATSCAVRLLRVRLGAAGNAMALAGCIPMVPGAFFGKAILGFFAVTAPNAVGADATIVEAMQYMLRVAFTVGAIGAGLAIPMHLLRNRDF